MATQPRPLRFLYKKYACHVPVGDVVTQNIDNGHSANHLSKKKKAESLGSLHLLGREISKLERIQMFFAMSEDPCECPSVVNSTVGSASTQSRSSYSRREGNTFRSSSFRSRSQEFQSKYKLAASRCSPDHTKHTSQSGNGNSRVTMLPRLNNIYQNQGKENSKVAETKNTDDNRNILKVLIEERKVAGNQPVKATAVTSYLVAENDEHSGYNGGYTNGYKAPAASPCMHSATSAKDKRRTKSHHASRVSPEKLPRCPTSSTVDYDRLDSSYYQYLLDDFTSLTSSSTLRSVHSDPASSKASARAQRPSTSGTVGTSQRLRDLHTTCTSKLSTPAAPPPQPSTLKSPDLQWPPRYAIMPSWPSYEDIHTLNSCDQHRDIITRLYYQDKDGKYGRRSRDRSQRNSMRNMSRESRYYQKKKIHVVPSHTNTECAMCNLYKNSNDLTLCPPNTPLVTSHECQDVQSHLSTNYSLKVNHGSVAMATASSTPSLRLVRSSSEFLRTTPLTQARRREDTRASSLSRNTSTHSASTTNVPSASHNSKTYTKQPNKGVSYSWDTCKLTYIKAHA